MNTEHLHIFCEVVQHGNFAEVARKRNVNPSSISRIIAQLENQLNIRLFNRTTRKIVPTQEGINYFHHVQKALEELNNAHILAAKETSTPTGTLRLAAPMTYGQLYIPPILSLFQQHYPQLSIELILNDAIQDIIEDRIDLAIRLGTLNNSSYIAKKIAPIHFHLCASPDYLNKTSIPSTPNDILNHQCLIFPRNNHLSDWFYHLPTQQAKHLTPKGNLLITNSAAIKQCAMQGMGLALLPDWLVQNEITTGKLISLLPEYNFSTSTSQSSIWLVYNNKSYLPTKTRIAIDFFTQHLNHPT